MRPLWYVVNLNQSENDIKLEDDLQLMFLPCQAFLHKRDAVICNLYSHTVHVLNIIVTMVSD